MSRPEIHILPVIFGLHSNLSPSTKTTMKKALTLSVQLRAHELWPYGGRWGGGGGGGEFGGLIPLPPQDQLLDYNYTIIML